MSGGAGWLRKIVEDIFPGSWQQNVEISHREVTAHYAVFACMTLIASDIAKMPARLMWRANGIWKESFNVAHPAYALLKKPNNYQTRIQFLESWVLSKLESGNTYVLKQRAQSGEVIALHVLNPCNVMPLVAETGEVFYQISRAQDNLSEQREVVMTLPASEIIHDRFNCIYHPLVGISPLLAAGLSSAQGLAIQESVARFFRNSSNTAMVLTTPGTITEEDAARLQTAIHDTVRGKNIDKALVLEAGLALHQSEYKAVGAQVIEQLNWTAEVACAVLHVPPYKIGLGPLPSYNNIQALNVEYYSRALHLLIESIEALLDEGLAIDPPYGVDLDTSVLLRMDSVTQMQVLNEGSSIFTLDEQRAKLDLDPIEGGDTVYMQQQNYSVKALAKRDAMPDPFGAAKAEPPQTAQRAKRRSRAKKPQGADDAT